MSWAESVDRVLAMRRAARTEADRSELIRIIQELEKRCQVVVNREASTVLKDVPSWRSQTCDCGGEVNPRSGKFIHTSSPVFRGGMRTWADRRRTLERNARAGSEKLRRRTEEFEQVLNGRFGVTDSGAQAGVPVPQKATEENSDAVSSGERSQA